MLIRIRPFQLKRSASIKFINDELKNSVLAFKQGKREMRQPIIEKILVINFSQPSIKATIDSQIYTIKKSPKCY